MTLYEISEDYKQLLSLCDDPDDEVFKDTLEGIQGELEVKAEGYGVVLKEMEAKADFLKKTAKELTERAKRIETRHDNIEGYMIRTFEGLNLTEVNTTHFDFKVKTNPPKVVFDLDEKELVDLIGNEYVTEKVTKTISKTLVKDAIKAGKEVYGAHLEQEKALKY